MVEVASLLISSPMMARGAQPYMAQELSGVMISDVIQCSAVEWSGVEWR